MSVVEQTDRSKFRNKRSKDQKVADAMLISQLLLRGKTQQEITAELNSQRSYSLSYQQIQKDVQKIRDEWVARARSSIDQVKARELAGLDEQEREAWAEWEKSKRDIVRKTATVAGKSIQPDKDKPDKQNASANQKTSVMQSAQTGDPAYMRLVLEIRDRRSKLLGLDAPFRSELSGPDGKPVQVEQQVTNIPEEHLTKLLREKLASGDTSEAPTSEA